MKKIMIIGFALAILCAGCKRVTVDFTYSPAEPKAGETVKFSNNSSAGESWAWSFGDNATSMSKHPNKVYKKPGEYVVTLMVDSAKYLTRSKIIKVYDTIPTFVCSSDSILLYHDVTLTANIYNPFKYELQYQWTLPNNCILQSGKTTDASIVVYFTSTGEMPVQLSITQNDKTYNINDKSLLVHPVKAPSILMRTTDNTIVRQRLINERLEPVSEGSEADKAIVNQTNDTVVTFNNVTFYASQMADKVPGFAGMQIQHMQMDAMAQKWYVTTTNGLMVANINGGDIVTIDAQATGAIYVDAERNRIYWANTDGLYAMPLIKSKNNQFTTTPTQYNQLNNIDLITVNNTPQ